MSISGYRFQSSEWNQVFRGYFLWQRTKEDKRCAAHNVISPHEQQQQSPNEQQQLQQSPNEKQQRQQSPNEQQQLLQLQDGKKKWR
jgi:hypothetical protein